MFKIILCLVLIMISGSLYCCLRIASKCERELESMDTQKNISKQSSQCVVEDVIELKQTTLED